jgi:hypothetical protein
MCPAGPRPNVVWADDEPEPDRAVRDHARMVALCYDGSADAQAAIDRAGAPLNSSRVAVLQHADRPVVVVPSPAVTEAGAAHRRKRASQA